MEHEEAYYGRRIVVTTKQAGPGTWTSEAELGDTGERVSPAGEHAYGSEEEARRAALAAATAAIDRARASRGKP
jgi:hypothetical protein